MNQQNQIVVREEKKNKKGFWKRNKEKIKTVIAHSVPLTGIVSVLVGILLHLINPAFGFLTIPFAIQVGIITAIEKGPQSWLEIKNKVLDHFKDEDEQTVSACLDDIVSLVSAVSPQGSSRSTQNNEPNNEMPETPNENREAYNAYYSKTRNEYIITPRIPKPQ